MSKKYILSEMGEVVEIDDLKAWAVWFDKSDASYKAGRPDARFVARHEVHPPLGKRAEVSTVFLGIDHNFGDGPPLLFETMIFGGKYDNWQDRYATREEALAGHEAAIRMVEGPFRWLRIWAKH